jgi:membrane fusion protein (multidrug efflux system)
MTRRSVLALPLLVFLFLSCGKEEPKKISKERVFSVRTVTVQEGEFYTLFRTSGHFEAVHSVRVRPEVSGRVEKIYGEEGDRVKAGQSLLKMEDSLYRKAYEEALYKLKRAEKELRNAEALYRRRRSLFEKELISREELEEFETRFESLKAELESLRAIAERRKIELERTVVRSPIDGFVLKRMTEEGDYLTPQREAYEIVKLSPLRFVFRVPQEIAKTLKKGQRVLIVSGNRKIEARVTYISPSADRSRLFTVKALVKNTDGSLKPGTYGEVLFEHEKVRAVSLPEQAVQLSQRQSFVWVVRNSRAVKLPVEVISHREGEVLVRGEFKEGDRVITEGILFLYEGAKVEER